MTLEQLQQVLVERSVQALNLDCTSLTVTLIGAQKRVAQGTADDLETAVELALMRYDNWRV